MKNLGGKQSVLWERIRELTTTENAMTYHNALCLSPQNIASLCIRQCLFYAAIWGYKQIASWHVMAFFVVILVTGK